jgi:hypothetical protein
MEMKVALWSVANGVGSVNSLLCPDLVVLKNCMFSIVMIFVFLAPSALFV